MVVSERMYVAQLLIGICEVPSLLVNQLTQGSVKIS